MGAVLGEVVLCTKMAEFDAKKFADFSGKGDNKKKEAKPKAEPAKKKEPEKKKEAEPALDDSGIPAEPKKKDPMDALPKGTFDLEEWKRFYSNNEEDDSIKWFWEHFDHENYSIWQGDYKFNDELTMIFMSCILIGENNNSSISGIWVFKGHELAFDLCEDWAIDSPSYQWTKLDSKSEECKKLVTQYWKWEGEDTKGRKFNQGKILK